MEHKRKLRVMGILMVICLLVLNVFNVDMALAARKSHTPYKGTILDTIRAGTMYDLNGEIKEKDVPRIIGVDEARSRHHIKRMYDEEGSELNKAVFLNDDGTRTMYMFDYPIKYVDEKGNTQDVTFEIKEHKEGKYKYKTSKGNAITRFPEKLSDGIELTGEGTKLSLIPHIKESTATLIDDEIVSYVYDESTNIEYSLTYTGFKEDIVVNEYTGQTEYDFTIYTN